MGGTVGGGAVGGWSGMGVPGLWGVRRQGAYCAT
ncbi:GlyGly-CTERM sorting domain-containing protein [Streptomyces sp. NBC_00696]